MNLILADDESNVRLSLSSFLTKLGHSVTVCEDGMACYEIYKKIQPDVIITDIKMPKLDGLELLKRIKKHDRSQIAIIIITGHADMDGAIKALKYGAYDFLQKPIDVRELSIILDRYLEYKTLLEKYLRLKNKFNDKLCIEMSVCMGEIERLQEAYLNEVGLSDIYINSKSMQNILDLAKKYSTDRSIPVLIEGETGTGKEVIARFIHYYGAAGSALPFIPLNCGAISKELFEGELFGHEPGAFTGATSSGRKGKFEAADQGTLFFDEIGELPMDLQVKLLRTIEDKKVCHIGGTREVPVDVRVISATNKNLYAEVTKGRFRDDLFYRINVGYIKIEPLRDRRDDLLPLAERFATRAFQRKGVIFENFSSEAANLIRKYDWPGNIRQLKNCIERTALFSTDTIIDINSLKINEIKQKSEAIENINLEYLTVENLKLPENHLDIKKFCQDIIRIALLRHNGNKTETAKYLGLSRKELMNRIEKM